MPDPTTTTLAALLRDAAQYIEANDIGADVLGVTYSYPYTSQARISIQLRSSAWSRLCAGMPVTWDASAGIATATATVPQYPGLLLVTIWQLAELEVAAPEVAAMVFPPRIRYSAGAWPGVRS